MSARFADAIVAAPGPTIDVTAALRQHHGYVAALRSLGLIVEELAADDAQPDCCFVEDCAVVAGGAALIARSGAPARRGEVGPVAAALAGHGLAVHPMAAPATLDGGDCLRLGSRLYVGCSPRTNEAGIDAARELFGPLGLDVIAVPLSPGVLHLKCICAPLDDETVLLAEGTIDAATFAPARVVSVPAAEAYAANAVAHDGAVIVSAGFPRTAEAVQAAGFRVFAIEASEVRKADGSLTCLSILF